MSIASHKQSIKSKGRRNRTRSLGSPRLWLPNHLSSWPTINVLNSTSSDSRPKSSTKSGNAGKSERVDAQDSPPSYENNQSQQADSTAKRLSKRTILSLSDDEDDKSTTTTSSRDSRGASADGNYLTKDRSGSNLHRKMDDLSSGSDCELTDQESDGKASGSQLTLEDGASERKGLLKDATASQKGDKNTGRKKNQDKGGVENVFNARPPEKQTPHSIRASENVRSSQTQQHPQGKASPVTNFLDTLSREALGSDHNLPSTPSLQSTAKLHTKLNENAIGKDVPVRLRPRDHSTTEPIDTELVAASQGPKPSLTALTEAQLRANFLRRSGHREFSSKAFEVSDGGDNEKELAETSKLGIKGTKKKAKTTPTHFNPVEVEIAKQQARLREHTAKKMKDNPERYLRKADDRVYELSTDDDSNGGERSQVLDFEGIDRTRDAVAPSPCSQEKPTDRSVTKNDKKKRKRKRDRVHDEVEGDDHRDKKHKRLEQNDDDLKRQHQAEFEDFLDLLQDMAAKFTKGMKKKDISAARRASLRESLISLQEVDLDEPPPPTDYHKAKQDAALSGTLESLWPLLPKALLHATMRNLNNTNRALLGDKLKLCLKGKQANPNIRVVTRVNDRGETVDLLEEYGVICEPDPYTMSSGLTLLTAAKSLIVLLSGKRTGLDVSAMVERAIEGKDDMTPVYLKQGAQGNSVGLSPMEEELRRIAAEREQEIERLKTENRILLARLNKAKR